jgi:poly(beta-D-mannuronate) lyase
MNRITRRPAALLATTCVLFALRLGAAEFSAADTAQLSAALAKAQPGDAIILADGTWRDARLELTRGGTASAPLRLRAQTPGGVVFTGASSLTFAAPHVEVDGVFFKGGALAKGNVVQFNSDHGRLTNSAIVDYNPPASATGYYWVYFAGSHNRVDRCLFKGKNHHQPLVGNDLKGSRHNTVELCHFKDITWVNQNGREIFRIWGYGGNEELGPDGAFFTIEGNLFEQAHGEGQEIISLKSNRNVVRNNTLRGSRGGITNRSGNFNTIEGNFIFGDGQAGTYGLRITGQFHRITHNYIEGVSGFGINVLCGELFLEPLTDGFKPILRAGTVHGRVPAYNQPRNTTVAFNTLVNNAGPDLVIGSDYKSGWPARQRVLLPENCFIANNLISRTDGGVAVSITAPDTTAPLDRLAFAGNRYDGNLVSGGTIKADAPPPPAGIAIVGELKFARDANGALRPTDATLAQSSAAAAPAVFSKEPSPFRPLTAADVGPAWMKR